LAVELLIGLEVGPDVYLYVVAYDAGEIYRIAPGHLDEDIPGI
jgi:hypothetical protein